MPDLDELQGVSRRAMLRTMGGTVGAGVGLAGVSTAGADDGSERKSDCPDATVHPSGGHCAGSNMEACADDRPTTIELQEAVRDTLEERYATVGELIDQGFLPYFDTLDESTGYSHWLSPEFIDDEGTLDPDRPESVLVDNEHWRPIGVMFIATRNGEPMEQPPVVYGDREEETHCAPWHYHSGLPGRFAWWYYRQVYEGDYEDGDLSLPCRTPCMMHLWTVPHPDSLYAHDPPPREYRDLAVADEAGFDTPAEPGEDELDWETLPDDALPDTSPDELLSELAWWR